MKVLVLNVIGDDNPRRVNLMDVADISFEPNEDHDVTVTLDSGASYMCDFLIIQDEE